MKKYNLSVLLKKYSKDIKTLAALAPSQHSDKTPDCLSFGNLKHILGCRYCLITILSAIDEILAQKKQFKRSYNILVPVLNRYEHLRVKK